MAAVPALPLAPTQDPGPDAVQPAPPAGRSAEWTYLNTGRIIYDVTCMDGEDEDEIVSPLFKLLYQKAWINDGDPYGKLCDQKVQNIVGFPRNDAVDLGNFQDHLGLANVAATSFADMVVPWHPTHTFGYAIWTAAVR